MPRGQKKNCAAAVGNAPAANGYARRRATTTDSATQEDQCHQKKIFVGGLGPKTSTQTLRDHFQGYGAIVDAVVLRWPDGRSRGFGYVTFATTASASSVLKDAHHIERCEVDVKRAVPGTNKLFVGGLPQNITAGEMRLHFEQFGIVSDAVVMMDAATNRSRGFGFICFSPGQDGADAVITALAQYDRHYLRGKWIEVKSAAPPRKLAEEQLEELAAPGLDRHGEVVPRPYVQGASVAPPAEASRGDASARQPHRAQMVSSLPPPSGAADFAAPPGLRNVPVGASEPQWIQASSKVHQPSFATAPLRPGAAAAAPLPSLLRSSHLGHFGPPNNRRGDAKEGFKVSASPMKISMSSDFTSGLESSGDTGSSIFGASLDLRRSLEELLRLQSEQTGVTVAR